jgi:AraC-like DNA-binding protein
LHALADALSATVAGHGLTTTGNATPLTQVASQNQRSDTLSGGHAPRSTRRPAVHVIASDGRLLPRSASDGRILLFVHRDLRVVRGESPAARWEMTDATPAAGLRSMVQAYCGYSERSLRPVRRQEFAVPRIVLVVGFGDAMLVVDAAGSDSGRRLSSFVAGLGEGVTHTEHAGAQDGLEVRLTPLGAYQLLGVPTGELTNRVVGLDNIWGRAARQLTERLAEAANWETRFAHLDRVFMRAAEGGPRPDRELVAAWSRLDRRHGDLAISELVADTGWSRRRLAERFRTQVGLTPKSTARIMRFARAVELLTRPGHRSLASIALSCGYYDQAHFNRDFQALAGCTPTEYLAARLVDLPGTGSDPTGDG